MSQKGRTPDERFLFKLYEAVIERGDPHAEIEILGIARSLGQKETATKNIIKHLAQANFVKKVGETRVVLTRRGFDFALNEIDTKSKK